MEEGRLEERLRGALELIKEHVQVINLSTKISTEVRRQLARCLVVRYTDGEGIDVDLSVCIYVCRWKTNSLPVKGSITYASSSRPSSSSWAREKRTDLRY